MSKRLPIIKNGTDHPHGAPSAVVGREFKELEMNPVAMHMKIADIRMSGIGVQADVG